MSRRLLWPILVIGVALIVMPLVISLPGKASSGQTMLDNFRPIMQPANVSTTVDYYNKTFVPLRAVAVVGTQAAGEAPKLIAALATQLHTTPGHVQQFLGTQFPAMSKLLGSLPQLVPVFANVPPGLAHYKPLVDTMQGNVTNYAQIDSAPNFRLFAWFFVIPGVLLVGLCGWGLLSGGRVRRGRLATRPGAAAAHS